MHARARQLVGREEHLGAIARALDVSSELPVTVVYPGEAGIGKTAVWLAGLEAASERGYRLLSSRPSETEARFSYSVLHDLLGEAAAETLCELPPLQRRSLEAALLLGETDVDTDERAVATAFLGALRRLSARGPVCIAVDDAQWVDTASRAALAYALARLEAEAVASLLTVRGQLPPWLRRAVPDGRLRAVPIEGLSVGAVQELIRLRLDVTFPRPTLIRIWETSRGNPLFALELAAALERRGGALAPGEPLPIPSELDELLSLRIDGLGPEAIRVARAVAALADPAVAVVERAVGHDFEPGLEEALAAQILELDGERLRFTHPLLGSAVAAQETPTQRRRLHARLAQVAASGEERALHVALATTEPSRESAAIVEDAARAARARGAPAAAAELAEHALRLTPAGDEPDARRRLLFAADRHHVAGDSANARRLLERARDEARRGPERATILAALGDVLVYGDPRAAEDVWRQALEEAEGDHALEALLHSRYAGLMAWGAGIEEGLLHADLALRAASLTDDVELRARVLASDGDWRFRGGQGVQRARMGQAIALERSLDDWPLTEGPAEMFCMQLMWADEVDEARALAFELRSAHRAQDNPHSEAEACWLISMLEWRAGNWDDAERHVDEMTELKELLGALNHTDEFPGTTLAAHRGRSGEARARADRAVARGSAGGVRIEESGNLWVRGFVALSEADPASAIDDLRRSYAIRDAFMLDPGQRLELGDLLEALIAVGELGEAEDILSIWEPRARALDRAWAKALLARGRGLLLATRGDFDGAFSSLEDALAEHARGADPFQHARTLLALGRVQRRAKRRGAARATLEDATARFDRLPAPLWAAQARAELARIGGRPPSGDELTEAEQRIAMLVAEGRTNREVAAALFLTEHTVETALTRIYRKLGVRSRAELASRLAANS